VTNVKTAKALGCCAALCRLLGHKADLNRLGVIVGDAVDVLGVTQ
jgi:hypothetical protein